MRNSNSLRISGQHMDLGESFRSHIEDKVHSLVGKYFDGDFDGHVTLIKSNGSRYTADCLLHLNSGVILQTAEQNSDPRQAFENAMERLETRFRRYKKRRLSHRRKSQELNFFTPYTHHVMQPAPQIEEEMEEEFTPIIIAEKSISLPRMSVAQAVIELDFVDDPVLFFRNAGNEEMNLVYRRSDGNIGWVDPSSSNVDNISANK